MTSSLKLAKQQVRAAMKARLAAIPVESIASQSKWFSGARTLLLIAAGRAAFEALNALGPYKEARRISVYLSMPGGEIQTDAIVRHALSSGKQVFVPFLFKSHLGSPGTPSRIMDMVQLNSIADYESLEPDKWGIPSIDPVTVNRRRSVLGLVCERAMDEDSTLDLMLLPGVAFDVDEGKGAVRRLGHGKGFYDFFIHRYLDSIAASPTPDVPNRPMLLYGLSLTEQRLRPPSDTTIPAGPFDQPLDGIVCGDGSVITPKHCSTK
jgi:5-formyltetrahydrofolate cyclo-ligase